MRNTPDIQSVDEIVAAHPELEGPLRAYQRAVGHMNDGLRELGEMAAQPRPVTLDRARRRRELVQSLKDNLAQMRRDAEQFPLLVFKGADEFDRQIRSFDFKLRNRA